MCKVAKNYLYRQAITPNYICNAIFLTHFIFLPSPIQALEPVSITVAATLAKNACTPHCLFFLISHFYSTFAAWKH